MVPFQAPPVTTSVPLTSTRSMPAGSWLEAAKVAVSRTSPGPTTTRSRQFTESLVAAGAHVVICGRRAEPLEQAAAEITAAGGAASAVVADVSREEDLQRLAKTAGPADVLVNNAGYGKRGPWTEVTPSEWREVMAVNVDAPFRLAQLLVSGMIERCWGRVVNISSVSEWSLATRTSIPTSTGTPRPT